MVYEKIYSAHLWRTKVSHKLPVLLPSLKREERKRCIEGTGSMRLFSVGIFIHFSL